MVVPKHELNLNGPDEYAEWKNTVKSGKQLSTTVDGLASIIFKFNLSTRCEALPFSYFHIKLYQVLTKFCENFNSIF